MHLSYTFCRALEPWWRESYDARAAAAAAGSGPDPLEWMEEAGVKLRVRPLARAAPGAQWTTEGRHLERH
jgi:hypothetical protein